MLLISVDRSYSFDKTRAARAKKNAKKIFAKLKLDWPNVFAPDGWDEVMKKFNLSGYGLTLVDANGIVRGVNIHEKQLKQLMRELYPEVAPDKKTPTKTP